MVHATVFNMYLSSVCWGTDKCIKLLLVDWALTVLRQKCIIWSNFKTIKYNLLILNYLVNNKHNVESSSSEIQFDLNIGSVGDQNFNISQSTFFFFTK